MKIILLTSYNSCLFLFCVTTKLFIRLLNTSIDSVDKVEGR